MKSHCTHFFLNKQETNHSPRHSFQKDQSQASFIQIQDSSGADGYYLSLLRPKQHLSQHQTQALYEQHNTIIALVTFSSSHRTTAWAIRADASWSKEW